LPAGKPAGKYASGYTGTERKPMGFIAIDHPDEVIHWFAAYPESERARGVAGECPHACQHRILKVVGWGPDLTRYELHVCDDVCQGNCRGWSGPATYDRLATIDWKLLEDPG
jgi:hypothetical protein